MSSTATKHALVLAAIAVVICGTAKAESAKSTVARLYKDFAWQALSSQSELFGDVLANQKKSVLERYFSPDLAALFVQDASCQAKTKEICNLDFDPLFASQDPSVADLEIGDATANTVPVEFKSPASNAKVKLEFKVTMITGTWKINDIVYTDMNKASLRKILSKSSR